MVVLVEQVPVWLILPLRQRVLRPLQDISEVHFEGDADGTHFAAFDDGGAIVGAASLLDAEADAVAKATWRLRGMAVSPECQLHGVGREVMLAVLGFVEVTDQGGIWCAARASAVGFYEKFCFKVVSGPYEEPGIGQHVRMERHGSWGAGIRGEWAESGEQGRE